MVTSSNFFQSDDLLDEEATDEEEIQELIRLQYELDFHNPKLKIYNKTIYYISMVIKIVAILMMIYGSTYALYDLGGE